MLNKELFLPADYQTQASVNYFDDTMSVENGTLYQPEVYPVAQYLLDGTGRTRIIDVGCGVGRKLASADAATKLGIDFGANIAFCRTHYGAAAEWREVDLSQPAPADLVDSIGPQDVVICSDVVEHLMDPRPLLDFLRQCFSRGALVITSTPERALVRGEDHVGPPPNRSHIREWTLDEYRALLNASGLPPLYIGLTLNNGQNRLLRTIISVHEPMLQTRFEAAATRPLAIISCFNEADIVVEVIEHWIAEGCDVHVLDNWSTDDSWLLLSRAADRFGSHMALERFPEDRPSEGSWRHILARKEEIALTHPGRWIIHSDADEIRASPFPQMNLADAMHMSGLAGWNRISFTVLNHRPVDDRPFLPGSLQTALPYFEYGTKPGHFVQYKAWLQGEERVSLVDSAGHAADFRGAADNPYQFVLHHFPLRSVEHGRRKINVERRNRWSLEEQANGWHSHYAELAGDTQLVWPKDRLGDVRNNFWACHGLQIMMRLQR